MGNRPDQRAWKTGAEAVVAANQENSLSTNELVKRYAVQARNFAQTKENAGHVRAFLNQNFHTFILKAKNKESALNEIRLNQPHFIPDSVEGKNHQDAFIEALAIELSKPEYNQ